MKVTRDYLRKVILETLELEASKKPSPATLRTIERYKSKVKGALYQAMGEASEAIFALSQSSYKGTVQSHIEELRELKQKIQTLYQEIYGKEQSQGGGDRYNDSRGSDYWKGSVSREEGGE